VVARNQIHRAELGAKPRAIGSRSRRLRALRHRAERLEIVLVENEAMGARLAGDVDSARPRLRDEPYAAARARIVEVDVRVDRPREHEEPGRVDDLGRVELEPGPDDRFARHGDVGRKAVADK